MCDAGCDAGPLSSIVWANFLASGWFVQLAHVAVMCYPEWINGAITYFPNTCVLTCPLLLSFLILFFPACPLFLFFLSLYSYCYPNELLLSFLLLFFLLVHCYFLSCYFFSCYFFSYLKLLLFFLLPFFLLLSFRAPWSLPLCISRNFTGTRAVVGGGGGVRGWEGGTRLLDRDAHYHPLAQNTIKSQKWRQICF